MMTTTRRANNRGSGKYVKARKAKRRKKARKKIKM